MGFLDKLDTLELDDEVKAQLRQEHEEEVGEIQGENSTLKRETRRESVEREIQELGGIGLSDPGLAKFVRRVYLSDDEEVGIVLLTDAELQLSGDEATGARSKEEKSTAGVLREFISLLPRNDEGKLDLGSMALADNAGDSPIEDEEEESENAHTDRKKHFEGVIGRPITRTRSRYQRKGAAAAAGGEK